MKELKGACGGFFLVSGDSGPSHIQLQQNLRAAYGEKSVQGCLSIRQHTQFSGVVVVEQTAALFAQQLCQVAHVDRLLLCLPNRCH